MARDSLDMPLRAVIAVILATACVGDEEPRVPDEQRLYQDLMYDYESSVRPILNASRTIVIDFKLSLNQIVDLDERTQVLTTNVFIDQEWKDDKLNWDPDDYNGIKTLRVPAELVWLPDTFIFNNADNGATGFMQGVYVVVDHNGTVLWPVPVKLKSSCKVDITYFPFDDQRCILRFGSWIYSGEWMDFTSSLESVDLEYFIDNSEWELVAIQFQKSVREYACCPKPHPDLTYTLHMRRRIFYYIFNIIVPCIMLSILTLLTFWLPTTSGEKISLGLSVFLAFSMFMLLIAEEVPATSESVPLIGVYLTTVMTMTSVSVIMSVMVINLYNRGYRAHSAPMWLKTVILNWLCRLLRMKQDIAQLANTIRLDEGEEEKYACATHGIYPRRRSMLRSPRHSVIVSPLKQSPATSGETSPVHHSKPLIQNSPVKTSPVHHSRSFVQTSPNQQSKPMVHASTSPNICGDRFYAYESGTNSYVNYRDCDTCDADAISRSLMEQQSHGSNVDRSRDGTHVESDFGEEEEEPVWRRRKSMEQCDRLLKNRRDPRVMKETKIENNNYDHNGLSTESIGRSNLRTDKQRTETLDQNQAKETYGHTLREENPAMVNGLRAENLPPINPDDGLGALDEVERQRRAECDCNKKRALRSRREIIVEWQTMAMVIDRLLFWVFLLATVLAYIIILLAVPYVTKVPLPDDVLPLRALKHS